MKFFKRMYPSKYLKAADLNDQEAKVTMSHVDMEDVGDADKKPVLYFNGKTKGLVLNKTNGRAISKTYGDETEEWKGKDLILYPAMVDFRGDMVEAIRVRVPKQMGASGLAGEKKYTENNPPPIAGNPLDDDIPFIYEWR